MKQRMPIILLIILWALVMAVPASAAPPVPVNGTFTAVVNSITPHPTPGDNHCLLEVDGELIFNGDLEGTASGTTQALVFAPCAEAQTNPPGTFPDVFKSELELTDPESGEHIADIIYQGKTQAGGEIKAVMHFSNGLKGTLKVEAVVAVGGSYSGFIKTQ